MWTKRIVEIVALLTVIIWGVNTPVMKIGLTELPPVFFNATRLLIAATIAWVCLLWSGTYRTVDKKDISSILSIGLFGFCFCQILLSIGLPKTTAGNAGLMSALMPLCVVIINKIGKHQDISLQTATGMSVSLIGAVLVIWGSGKQFSLAGEHLLGSAIILLSQFGIGYYTVYSKDLLEKYSTYQIITYVLTITAMVFSAAAIPEFMTINWGELPSNAWLVISFSSVFGLFLGNFSWVWIISEIGSTRASLYQNLVPIFSVIAAGFLLGEVFGYMQAVGAAIIFTGLYITRWKSKERQDACKECG